MITAGIDVGLETTKAVILKGGAVLGKAKTSTGGVDRAQNIEAVYQAALHKAGLAAVDVDKITVTGKGKYDAPGEPARMTEQTAAARAARFFCPDATFVVSVGADETMAATLGKERLLQEYAFNMKCTAGLGLYLSFLADRLGLSQEEMSSLDTQGSVSVNDNCVVLAELDAIGLLSRGTAPEEIGAAAVKAAAVRACAVINDLTTPDKTCAILIGGLAKNKAFVSALSSISGIRFITPEDADYAGAIGAALP